MVRTRRSGGNDEESEDNDILCLMTENFRRTRTKPERASSDESLEPGPARYQPRKKYNMRTKTTSPFRRTSYFNNPGDSHNDDDEDVMIRRNMKRELRFNREELEMTTRRSTRRRRMVYGTFNLNDIDKFPVAGSQFEEGLARHSRRKTPSPDGKYTKERPNIAPDPLEDGQDMYSRVKRKRRQVTRNMYGIPIAENNANDDSETEIEDENKGDRQNEAEAREEEEVDEEEEETESSSSEDEEPRQYYLREHRPRTQIFEAAPAVAVTRPQTKMLNNSLVIHNSPARRRSFVSNRQRKSPAHRSRSFGSSRRRAALNGSSSTSSSSADSSDEERFKRRKAKSMQKSRGRCLPMNFDVDDVTGVLKDRQKIGSSLADVDPMNIDRSVTFDSVGGLDTNIRALKEMIIFPLMYPEVFEKFSIQPPRGVLFHGLPGCGKTLVARALANECSKGNRKVAFFMRKGADCLSKWVGESERQLRLLFDQAYQMRPSILFFDEIDGLAPVRSSRQDQIHSSIVSTLLALMDGLDSRGEVVVIGATNRVDSIDPALRRPGRFDREFLFPLPSLPARKQILEIHTKKWNPPLPDSFVNELAQRTVGYCGADLRSLCTEAALLALRRRYPQIYTTSDKLQLDINSIRIGAQDFARAMDNIVPASQRSISAPGRALNTFIVPLLNRQFQFALQLLRKIFPVANKSAQDDLILSDNEDEFVPGSQSKLPSLALFPRHSSGTYRPRLLIAGLPSQGQSSHLAPALLHSLERFPTHVLDLPALYGVSAKSPEESCAQIFREAKRTSPSILYMPHIDQWWEAVNDTLLATFKTLLQDMAPDTPVLLIATCDKPVKHVDAGILAIFCQGSRLIMDKPNYDERKAFFEDLFTRMVAKPPKVKRTDVTELEVLPAAPPPEPRTLTEKEQKRLVEQEDATLRELRLFLRDAIYKLVNDRKFVIFAKPVDVEEVEDYYDVIKNPMDLSTMMSKIDSHQYQTAKDFLKDIDLICANALEYNPDVNPHDKSIRHRACSLRDLAHSIIENELDSEFEKRCEEIASSREKRGDSPTKNAPNFCKVTPRPSTRSQSSRLTRSSGLLSTDDSCVGGLHDTPAKKRVGRPAGGTSKKVIVLSASQFKAREAKRKRRSPWCKPTRRNNSRRRIIVVDDEPEENDDDDDDDEHEVLEEEDNSDDVKLSTVEEKTEETSESTSEDAAAVCKKARSLRSPDKSKTQELHICVDSCSSKSKSCPKLDCKIENAGVSPRHSLEARRNAEDVGKISPRKSSLRSPQRSPRSGSPRIISPCNIMDTSEMNGVSEASSKTDSESVSSMPKLTAPSPITVSNEDSNKENDLPAEAPTLLDTCRRRRRTASEMNDSNAEAEKEEASNKVVTRLQKSLSPPPKLVVDLEAMARLWSVTVDKTQDFDVETLENLHCQLRDCVHTHRHDYNKNQLLLDLTSTLDLFVRQHFSKVSSSS